MVFTNDFTFLFQEKKKSLTEYEYMSVGSFF